MAPALWLLLIALNVVVVAIALSELLTPTRVTARAAALAAMIPVGGAVAFLVLARPALNLATAAVLLIAGLALGYLAGRARPVNWVNGVPHSRASTPVAAVWAGTYLVGTNLPQIAPSAEAFAAGALATIFGAALAGASSVGLLSSAATRVAATTTPIGPPPSPGGPPMAAPPTVGPIHVTHAGNRLVAGYTATEFGIWDPTAWARPLARLPRTPDGRAEMWRQFTALESGARPVAADPASLALVAEVPADFTHTGARFAIGRTADRYGIWDRWTPGQAVAWYPATDAGALEAWRTFVAWEPAAQPTAQWTSSNT